MAKNLLLIISFKWQTVTPAGYYFPDTWLMILQHEQFTIFLLLLQFRFVISEDIGNAQNLLLEEYHDLHVLQ